MVSEEMNMADSSMTKSCADCKTTSTPLWRVGPSGPKSLCNACGIKYRRKGVSVVGPSPPERKRERPQPLSPSSAHTVKGIDESVRMSLIVLGNDVLFQRPKKQRKKRKLLGEEEVPAAISLMAMSGGSVSILMTLHDQYEDVLRQINQGQYRCS